MKKIIDISAWQSPNAINYDDLAKSIDGVILRIGVTHWGQHVIVKDEHFETHYAEFKKRNVSVGVYYYSSANTVQRGIDEANAVKNWLRGKKLELPVYFDTENEQRQRGIGKKLLTDITVAFCDVLEKAGYFVGVYASASWFTSELELNRLKRYTLWVAHYGLLEATGIERYLKNDVYDMWQFTSKGRLNGYNGNLDVNYLKRDLAPIIMKGGFNGYPKGNQPAPEVEKPKPKPQPAPEVENNNKETTTTRNYKVIKGDTLGQIANRFGTTVDSIMKLNPQIKNRNLIYPNQIIQLQEVSRKYYKIEKGDTFSKIANAHGLTVKQLQELNPRVKNINLIYPNQFLRVK